MSNTKYVEYKIHYTYNVLKGGDRNQKLKTISL